MNSILNLIFCEVQVVVFTLGVLTPLESCHGYAMASALRYVSRAGEESPEGRLTGVHTGSSLKRRMALM